MQIKSSHKKKKQELCQRQRISATHNSRKTSKTKIINHRFGRGGLFNIETKEWNHQAAHSQEGKQPFLSFMRYSFHHKHALTPSAFGFSSSLAGSFFSAFSGACKTQIACLGASEFSSNQKLPQKKKKQELCQRQRISATHNSHNSHKASKPKPLFQRRRVRRAVQNWNKRMKPPTAHSQEGKQPFLSFMRYSGHHKHALTPSAFGFSTSLAGSFFSAFSGACKTHISCLGASQFYANQKLQQKTGSKSCANCKGLLPHITHTTHTKHQSQNHKSLFRTGRAVQHWDKRMKPPAARSQEGKHLVLIFMRYSFHDKHALTPSAFGFSTSLAGSFFSAFSGACKTQIACLGASEFYANQKLPQKNRKQELCKLQGTSATHNSHNSHKASKPNHCFREGGLFNIETKE